MFEPALDLLVLVLGPVSACVLLLAPPASGEPAEPGEPGSQLEHEPGHDHVLELAYLPVLEPVSLLVLESKYIVLGRVLQSGLCWICY